MSALFPLYALGALAIVAPILFHLFQRKPHGQQEFSSLMFLRATPPKLTRRSRLSDLMLLLLRGLALLLLAAAFARPFTRSPSLLDLDAPSRSVALLVDTSASLRRDGMWEKLQDRIAEVVKDLRPTDEVMLVSYDREPTNMFSFEAWEEMAESQRIPFLKEQLKSLKPTWFETDLSAAAISASDALLQQHLTDDLNQPLHVVVFTDLQRGSDLSGLQSYEWPEDITVDIRSVSATKKTNASLQALPPEASEMDSAQVRVLVRNATDSERGQFQVRWNDANANPVDVYVPPGQTRVVKVTQPRGARQLDLLGDENEFDNQLYLTETTLQRQKLWYIGDDDADDKRGLFFYLRQSALDTRTREVDVTVLENLSQLATVLPQQVPLCILSKPLQGNAREDLQRYVSRGGRVLVVLQRNDDPKKAENNSAWSEMETFLAPLLGLADVQIRPQASDDYTMLSQIDFKNSLFEPFADPRFNDFTKIRFWSHQLLDSSIEEPWGNVAKFEDESPALIEKRIDKGIVWVLSCGWQPVESQLALSSKFIPLLHGFFGKTPQTVGRMANFEVGQPIKITATEQTTSIVAPSGETFVMPANSDTFNDANEPGIYQVQQGMEQYSLAVNLPNAESQTEPLLTDRLEQLGLRLGRQQSVALMKKQQRQMRNKELEGQQKLWRWGIVAALLFVALETLLSSRARLTTAANPAVEVA